MQFYNANQSRRFPLADQVSLRSDTGSYMPTGLIVDMSLAVDLTYGSQYYISAISKQQDVCTLVISAAESLLPLATATVNVSNLFFQRGMSPQVPVSPILDTGIYGTVVFGERFSELDDVVMTFADPEATMIHPRAIFPVAGAFVGSSDEPPPSSDITWGTTNLSWGTTNLSWGASELPSVTAVGQRWAVFRSAQTLSGNVVLSQDGDIEVVFEPRQLGSRTVNAVIFRLANSGDVLTTYAASQQRPESNTCTNGRILTINGVQADCCGRIFFEFRGCAQFTRIINHCGVVLECPVAIDEICPPAIDYGAVVDIDECGGSAGGNVGPVPINQPDKPRYEL